MSTSEGTRGFGPTRANGYGAVPLEAYLERATTEPWVILQIEHIDAVRNLAEICAVPGIGSLLVGPFDLSASMGVAGQVTHPDVSAQLDTIARIAGERGVTFGAFALSCDEASVLRWLERGVSWLALDTDQALLRGAALRALGAVGRLQRES
jgi:2-keto-3-deoxy-L-rhamnonate aldolase RhmA